MDHLKAKIREIPDFPKPGILFYDITTLLCDGKGFADTIDALAAPYMGEDIDQVIGIESRGFILGAAVANALGCGFVPVRKPGKLPGATHKEAYSLEYGDNALEIHQDACASQQRILIVDDVLATGGTARAAAKLVERVGGKVCGIATLIELDFLRGREKVEGFDLFTLIHY
jgi:adenine phosphoribosyltransferase